MNTKPKNLARREITGLVSAFSLGGPAHLINHDYAAENRIEVEVFKRKAFIFLNRPTETSIGTLVRKGVDFLHKHNSIVIKKPTAFTLQCGIVIPSRMATWGVILPHDVLKRLDECGVQLAIEYNHLPSAM